MFGPGGVPRPYRPHSAETKKKIAVSQSLRILAKKLGVTKQEIVDILSKAGAKGGKIGGKRTMAARTPEQRSKLASKASKARWKK